MARELSRLAQPQSAAGGQRKGYGTATVATGARREAIDAVRGAVMVIMALDHVRDFVHSGAMTFQPEDLAQTTPILFLTRWVTHVCAPAFVLLAGIAANRRLQRDGSAPTLSVYLATRGLWLIVVELTLLRFALNFRYGPADPWLLLVLCALGLSMMVLAPLIRLPTGVLGAAGLAVILLHNTLDNIRAADLGALGPLWMLLHQQGVFVVAGQVVIVAYPMLPWAGLLAVGFAAGGLFESRARPPPPRACLHRRSPHPLVPSATVVERLRRPAAMVAAGHASDDGALVPPDHEVPAIACLPADDGGPDAAGARLVRAPHAWASASTGRHREGPAVLLRRPLLRRAFCRVVSGLVEVPGFLARISVGAFSFDGRTPSRVSTRLRLAAVGRLRRLGRSRAVDVSDVPLVRRHQGRAPMVVAGIRVIPTTAASRIL